VGHVPGLVHVDQRADRRHDQEHHARQCVQHVPVLILIKPGRTW
jgi:hypothetical protein